MYLLLHSFLMMKRNFFLHCVSFLHRNDVFDLTFKLCDEATSFDWLCPIHVKSVKKQLLTLVSETLLVFLCKKINQHSRDKQKLHSQQIVLRNRWRLRNAVLSEHYELLTHQGADPDHGPRYGREIIDENWEDVECYLMYMGDTDDPDGPPATGNVTIFVFSCSGCLCCVLFLQVFDGTKPMKGSTPYRQQENGIQSIVCGCLVCDHI